MIKVTINTNEFELVSNMCSPDGVLDFNDEFTAEDFENIFMLKENKVDIIVIDVSCITNSKRMSFNTLKVLKELYKKYYIGIVVHEESDFIYDYNGFWRIYEQDLAKTIRNSINRVFLTILPSGGKNE